MGACLAKHPHMKALLPYFGSPFYSACYPLAWPGLISPLLLQLCFLLPTWFLWLLVPTILSVNAWPSSSLRCHITLLLNWPVISQTSSVMLALIGESCLSNMLTCLWYSQLNACEVLVQKEFLECIDIGCKNHECKSIPHSNYVTIMHHVNSMQSNYM